MRVSVLVSTLVVTVALAGAARAQEATADAAKQAAGEGRYCDALALYQQTFASTNEAKHLFNAAEVAFAADDKVTALQLFREVLAKFPDYPKRTKVEARIADLGRSIAKSGAGTACTTAAPAAPAEPAPACGNRVVDAGEGCDDGNRVEGDGCDSNCTPTRCGNGVRSSGELCDDGNSIVGDGCDQNCTVSACGNGVMAGAEQCDDGNTHGGDGCSAECTTERAAAPDKSSASALPWIVGGSLTAVVGAAAGIVGLVPAIGYLTREPELAQLERDFRNADDADEQAALGEEVASATEAQVVDANNHNAWGRWLAPSGLVLVGAGVAIAIAGAFVGGEESAE